MSNSSGYNRAYYEKNKKRIGARKGSRYKMDEGYRDAVKARAKQQREEQKKKRKNAPKSPKSVKVPKKIKVETPSGETKVARMYSLGQLAHRLDISIVTIRKWESENVIPTSTYRSKGNHRLYTEHQVSAVSRVYADYIINKTAGGPWRLTDDFVKALHEAWNSLPEGFPPEEQEENEDESRANLN